MHIKYYSKSLTKKKNIYTIDSGCGGSSKHSGGSDGYGLGSTLRKASITFIPSISG